MQISDHECKELLLLVSGVASSLSHMGLSALGSELFKASAKLVYYRERGTPLPFHLIAANDS